MKLEEGTILLQETCDEIRISLNGHTQDINRHTEHWLIQDVRANSYLLYNLDNGRTMKVKKDEMDLMLYGNKRYNIKPIFEISSMKG